MNRKPWTPQKIAVVVVATALSIPLLMVAAFFISIVAWFQSGIFFGGDGEYRTNVGEAAFQVAFPPIDLSRSGRYTYHFTRLAPALNYSVGFRLTDRVGHAVKSDSSGRPDLEEALRPRALVAITLTNERNEQVFHHVQRLTDWSWLRNNAEIRGKIVEVPIGGGSVQIDWVGVGPDEGWGTNFTPRWFGRYRLDIEVVEADQQATSVLAQPVMEAYVTWP